MRPALLRWPQQHFKVEGFRAFCNLDGTAAVRGCVRYATTTDSATSTETPMLAVVGAKTPPHIRLPSVCSSASVALLALVLHYALRFFKSSSLPVARSQSCWTPLPVSTNALPMPAPNFCKPVMFLVGSASALSCSYANFLGSNAFTMSDALTPLSTYCVRTFLRNFRWCSSD